MHIHHLPAALAAAHDRSSRRRTPTQRPQHAVRRCAVLGACRRGCAHRGCGVTLWISPQGRMTELDKASLRLDEARRKHYKGAERELKVTHH